MFEVIELGGVKTVTTKAACNHVYVVDVSGSMYNDLPAIRQHLKNIISVVAQPDDTFSVIYFSGKGQCGVVFENVLVSDVTTVTMMHTAIDRYLTTIGLTGFIDPIEKALTLNLDNAKVNNFIMMTDGSDNQSRRTDIIERVAGLNAMYQSIAFIEYGYYADRELLTKMADATNGMHIFAEGIVNYETALETLVTGVSRVSEVEVKVNKKAKHCVYIHNNQIKIVAVVDGVVSVPEDVERVHSIVPNDVLSKQLSEDHLYLILYYAAKTTNVKLTWDCLQALGDVRLYQLYENAFTKQELSAFETAVELAVLNDVTRYMDGKDLNVAPKRNAPTIVDLLNELIEVDGVSLVVSSPYFDYKRTSRQSVSIEDLPRFVPSPVAQVAMNNLTFSSERPNVSISTSVKGMVELPCNDFGLKMVPSFITRNYTIIRDGIRNISQLPVTIPTDAYDSGVFSKYAHEVLERENGFVYALFDLTKVPVISHSMVAGVDIETFKTLAVEYEHTKAELKVLNGIIASTGLANKVDGLSEMYGTDAAQWLSTLGVRDYGFSKVGTKSVEASDEYESIQVQYKIKGLSSLPAIKAVNDKVDAGKKLNLGDIMIKAAIDYFDGIDVSAAKLIKLQRTKLKREYEYELAREVYALVLGRKWYSEDAGPVVTTITYGAGNHEMTIDKVRKVIKL